MPKFRVIVEDTVSKCYSTEVEAEDAQAAQDQVEERLQGEDWTQWTLWDEGGSLEIRDELTEEVTPEGGRRVYGATLRS